MFTLHADVADDARDRVLEWVRRLAGVESAGPLRPNARSQTVRRMCFVRTSDASAAEEVLQALRTSPAVELAEPAAPRELPPPGTSDGSAGDSP